MNVLVTGGNGFVGRELVKRLLAAASPLPEGTPLRRLSVVDMGGEHLPADPRLHLVSGSIADPAVLDAALEVAPDLVFHLASIPGGAAERNFELGLQVNLHATLALFQRLAQQGRCPRVVFTSTIAVYGSPLPAQVDDASPLRPGLSYGAHKLVGEILLEDYSRRGLLDGRILRLPGIVARPPEPSGLLSAFMSDLFWKLAAGEPFRCPVSAGAVAWWMSVGCCAGNLLHAARLLPEQVAARRAYTLPVLRLSVAEVVEGLAARFGEERRALVDYRPDAQLEAAFGCLPPLDARAAQAIGFRHDGSVQSLVDNAMAWREPA
ncbi:MULTISPECIES: NAD-dependent epimerase/dehydratase family protein [unclassified Pseudomonas]|uniref:NAD-dependent epimerase/dehydratase family protein n=1 Tax=unclassified Pseudomonas TaxID=196821 RepID=UPI000D6F0BD6|nr:MULTISPECIES: NAD-dependent epimerase/dehydratase family protein [unclassified Pseudomonas]PWU25753.1 epimerase [Pseudomonas sp. RW407]